MNLDAAGEAISGIVNNQLSPDVAAAILDGLTGAQQRLEQCLPPDTVAAHGLRSALEAARSRAI